MKWWGGFAVIIWVLGGAATTHAASITDHIVINEIMAHPQTGEVEWIELYNPTEADVVMSGWRIAAMSGNFSGVFATDVIIPAKGYLVRKASDTTSKLNNTAATISLKTSANGPTINEVSYATIAQGMSYARTCDASEEWLSQSTPTEGVANCTPEPPADDEPPVISAIDTTTLKGVASIPVIATDASELTMTVTMKQYGAAVASSTGGAQVYLSVDTTVLPNGPVELEILAVDASGNSSTLTVTMTIDNPVVAAPPAKSDPVAEPVISNQPAPPRQGEQLGGQPSTNGDTVTVAPDVVVPALMTVVTRAVSVASAAPKTFATSTSPIATRSAPASLSFQARENEGVTNENAENTITSTARVDTDTARASRSVTAAIPSLLPILLGTASIVAYAVWRYLRRTKP